MRALHLSKVTGIAGSENHLLRLLPGLQACDVEVHMAVLEEPSRPVDAFVEALQTEHVIVSRIPIRQHLDPTLPSRLRTLMRHIQPDLVHTHLVHGDLYGLPAAKREGVYALVSSRHNDNTFRRRPLFKWVNQRAMRHADRVIAISDALAGFVVDVERIPAGKVITIPYGYTPPAEIVAQQARPLLETHGVPPGDQPLIGFVGRLIPQKGVDVLLDAFERVAHAHNDAHLVIVGDGRLRPELEAQAGPRVTFTGWIPDARAVMPAFEMLVVPSRWEGFGLVTLEAMGCRLPVVATRVSALPEIVVDGETGKLVQPEDPTALAAAILDVMRNRGDMGLQGFRRLLKNFSEQSMIQSTYRVYCSLIDG